MKNRFWQPFPTAALVVTLALASTAFASEKVLHSFTAGTGGNTPTTGLVSDAAGNLYGMTAGGGNVASNCPTGCGVVYKLTPSATGTWKEAILHRFNGGTEGWSPDGLALDAKGNIYGVNQLGGKPARGTKNCVTYGCGTLFRLSPNTSGGWTFTLLHAFTGVSDGINPTGVTVDAAGNVFAPARSGGTNGGMIFEMVGGTQGRTIYTFIGTANGNGPDGPVLIDAAGNLYGTTFDGGAGGLGVVYELTPSSSGKWTETILYSFTGGNDGSGPSGNLAFDSTGNLFGAADFNGAFNSGIVFELTPSSGGQWTKTTIYAFNGGADGETPRSGVVRDAAGNLFGTNAGGGNSTCYCGTVFELSPSSGGWSESTLYTFTGQADGGFPTLGPVLLDSSGNLYGATNSGGTVNSSCVLSPGCGVAYELPGVAAALNATSGLSEY